MHHDSLNKLFKDNLLIQFELIQDYFTYMFHV